MAATLVLALAQFPAGANVEQVSADAIWRLGAYYVPLVLVLWLSMIAVISLYRIDRAAHERNVAALQSRR